MSDSDIVFIERKLERLRRRRMLEELRRKRPKYKLQTSISIEIHPKAPPLPPNNSPVDPRRIECFFIHQPVEEPRPV
jgi:hypothetical protein